MTEEILEENTPVDEAAPMEEPTPMEEPEKTAREISEDVISTVKSICPQLEESVILDIDENDNIIFKIIDYKKFDISQDSLFYKENHPEDENSDKVNKLLEDIYEGVAVMCNTKQEGFSIYNFNNRYFVTTKDDFEQLRYNSLTDEEKAAEDKENKRKSLRDEISESKTYLSETDYIVTKINEVMAIGTEEDALAVKAEYSEQLTKRKEARAKINKLEKELSDLETSD